MSIAEIILGIVVLIFITNSSIPFLKATKQSTMREKERASLISFEKGFKNSFSSIISAYEPICSSDVSNSDTSWGWGHSACSLTSPFPIFDVTVPNNNSERIIYSLNPTADPAIRANLVNIITGSYAPYCLKTNDDGTKLTLRCSGGFQGFKYDDLAFGAYYHVLGEDIDSTNIPVISIDRKRHSTTTRLVETIENVHIFSMAPEYEKFRSYTMQKFDMASNTLKTFHTNKTVAEVNNQAPIGLNSTDDTFVPYFWEIFGTSTATAKTALCDKAGGTTCGNLNGNWLNSVTSDALLWNRIEDVFGIDYSKLKVDGFNNRLYFVPFKSQCTNVDMSTCSVTAPMLPQDLYYKTSNVESPFVTVIFPYTHREQDKTVPAFARKYIVY